MRIVSVLLVAVSALILDLDVVHAQTYPSRPISLVVPSGPGGTLDFVARKVGAKLSESLKQPVVIDNRPGASGIIGISHVMRSAPDGHTIIIGTSGSFPMNFVTRSNIPFHPVDDFAHLGIAVETDYILAVHPTFQAQNLREFIAVAQKSPNSVSYSSFGPGSVAHVFAEALSFKEGLKLLHIPYKSAPDALLGLVGGQVNATFDTALVLGPHIKDGKIRALAIAGDERSTLTPDVPTFSEAGIPGFTARAWFGFFAPARTPNEIVEKLNQEIVKAVRSPDLMKDFRAGGLKVVTSTPQQHADQIRKDIEAYGRVAKAANIRLD